MEGAINLFLGGFLAATTVMTWARFTADPDRLKDFPDLQQMHRTIVPLGLAAAGINVFVGIVLRYI